jgi:hypothetical protein
LQANTVDVLSGEPRPRIHPAETRETSPVAPLPAVQAEVGKKVDDVVDDVCDEEEGDPVEEDVSRADAHNRKVELRPSGSNGHSSLLPTASKPSPNQCHQAGAGTH